jgi:hypothetical protein
VPEVHINWKDTKNQKTFFDQLATKWNIQKLDDWNKVTTSMVVKEGGSFINSYYNSSLQKGTKHVYRMLTFVLEIVLEIPSISLL